MHLILIDLLDKISAHVEMGATPKTLHPTCLVYARASTLATLLLLKGI